MSLIVPLGDPARRGSQDRRASPAVLAKIARQRQARDLLRRDCQHGCSDVQLDELITLEHTKWKPVAVIVAAGHRCILSVDAAAIPASGPLAAISRTKFGPRSDDSRAMRDKLLAGLGDCIAPDATFSSDDHRHYPVVNRCHFPNAHHIVHRSSAPRSGGQGELKRVVFDPRFSINHTLAMMHANMNRLIRSSW